MDTLLDDLEPKLLWKNFVELCRIPRATGNEEAAAQWVAQKARAVGLEAQRDRIGNVLIRKPARPGQENRPTVCLQCHLDMVCEKDKDVVIDFARDPIEICRDGDILRGHGTTLGADNGVGVALTLAVMASNDIPHGPLELLFTVQEESDLGTVGADNIQPGWLKADYLLNLDAEIEGILIIGFAGDVDTVAERKLTLSPPPPGTRPYLLKVDGLRGGYSGLEINDGLGNALRLLAHLLDGMQGEFGFKLSSINGGNRTNAIPKDASAVIFMEPAREEAFRGKLREHQAHWRDAFGKFDPEITFTLSEGTGERVMSAQDFQGVAGVLLCAPHGVEAMNSDIPGLVQTSTNMGLIETKGDTVKVRFMTRSAIDRSKDALAQRIGAVLTLCGFTWRHFGGCSGWKPRPNSRLVKLVEDVYRRRFQKQIVIKAVHAGMECSTIASKFPKMDIVSLGPDIKDFHTTHETVTISSSIRFWELVKGLLEEL